MPMEVLGCAIVRDGDEILIAVPENRTVDFYNYLRSFGYCFTVHCRGFCENNVFSFPDSEDTDKFRAIVAAFGFSSRA